MIHLVLLSGGSGTRLWPLSNSTRSKQFLKVLRDADGNHVSMVQRVFGQIGAVDADIDITIATCASQEESIRRQVEGGYALVLETERRDTAPAIMLACANLALEQGAGEGDTVIVMPIDSYADQAYYDSVVRLDEAVQSDFAELVLMGVEPTRFTVTMPALAWPTLGLVAVLAVGCALVSILFCRGLHITEHLAARVLKDPFLRAAAGTM